MTPPWPYGNPKSITGILRFIDEDSWKTEVICKDDIDKEKIEQTTLNCLLSDILEIYNVDKLEVKITVEVVNPPFREPRYYLNDEEMLNKLLKDLNEIRKSDDFIPWEEAKIQLGLTPSTCGISKDNGLSTFERDEEDDPCRYPDAKTKSGAE
jgi:hypothetical protein